MSKAFYTSESETLGRAFAELDTTEVIIMARRNFESMLQEMTEKMAKDSVYYVPKFLVSKKEF